MAEAFEASSEAISSQLRACAERTPTSGMPGNDEAPNKASEPPNSLIIGTPRSLRQNPSESCRFLEFAVIIAPIAEPSRADLFSAVKLRMGRPTAKADIEALRAVKKTIGPDVTLMVDFNQALTVAEAIRRGRMIDEEGGVHWIEEPIRADDFAGCARVADEVSTPIQIGENFMGPEQMAQAIAAGCCDYVMPDAERIGGVTGWMRSAALAQGAGLEMSSHLFPEASVQLLAVTPTCHWLEFVDWAAPVLAEPVRIEKGFAIGVDGPGLGMKWNEKAVKKFAA